MVVRGDLGGSKNAHNSEVALEKLKNQSSQISPKLRPDHSARCPHSKSVNNTQI